MWVKDTCTFLSKKQKNFHLNQKDYTIARYKFVHQKLEWKKKNWYAALVSMQIEKQIPSVWKDKMLENEQKRIYVKHQTDIMQHQSVSP